MSSRSDFEMVTVSGFRVKKKSCSVWAKRLLYNLDLNVTKTKEMVVEEVPLSTTKAAIGTSVFISLRA